MYYGVTGQYFFDDPNYATPVSVWIDPRRSKDHFTSTALGLFGRLGLVIGGRELQPRHDHRYLRLVSSVLLSVK